MRIIILASERSGTNLLRTLLNNHHNISAPVAPHFFDAFKNSIPSKDFLKKQTNAITLVNQMLKLANHPFNDWKLLGDSKTIVKKYDVNSLAKAFDALYQEKAALETKLFYASKDNNLFNYKNELNELDNIKYIYLYRNPLDHVASWLKTPLFLHTAFDIAIKWRREQKTILNIAEQTQNLHSICYEDLIENPEREMTKVLNFLNVAVDENCFETDKNNTEAKRHKLWENISKPILSNNKNKYKNTLSKKDILIVESLCKSEMITLGYPLSTKANWNGQRGYGYVLKFKRKYSKFKNRKFFYQDMKILQEKLELLHKLRKELKS